MIGKTVSHYTISGELGRGGMGVVYRAHDDRLDRDVALKFLPPSMTPDAAARERFIREARAASSLDHQNICTIYDVGESEEGQTYIVMAYYEGRTLKARIDDGPLPVEEAVNVAVQIADGLAAAHRKGIVHRDVKPGNVIVTTDGVVKILDFGLAKLAGTKVELTAQDSTLGTAAYMSPEQARGEEIDTQTDVWSLGVVLYEMLAGRRPFAAEYEQALLYGILNEEPPALETVRPDVPRDVAEVVAQALRKDAGERCAGAGQFAADLRSGSVPIGSAVGIPLRQPSAKTSKARPSPRRLAGALLGAIAVVALGVWLLSRGGGESAAVESSVIAVMPFTVQGDPELEYLETGMVDLLSRKLDGAASLRGVDPNALLGRLGDNVKGIRDPAEAQRLAAGFGAGLFIIGSVTKIGGSIQLHASLYDTGGTLQTEAETTAGSEDQLMSSIDRLAQLVIADQLAVAGQTLDQTAATTTESLTALKAFLQGERALAEGRANDAVSSMREAVRLDSTFALAWYRLRDALGWAGVLGGAERDSALVNAVRYKERLPRPAQRMIDAEKAADEARFEDAKDIYEDVIRQQPDNVAALLKLGDLIYHNGDREGYPSVRAREYFERALSLNPENQEGQSHIILIAAKERDSVALDSLLMRFDSPPAANPMLDIPERLAAGERAEGSFYEEVRAMSRKSPQALFFAASVSAVVLEDLEEARRWIDLGVESPFEQLRRQAAGFEAILLFAKGNLNRGDEIADSLAAESPARAGGGTRVFQSLVAVTPYADYEPAHLEQMRDSLEEADLSSPGQNVLPSPLRGQEEALRHYVIGLLSFRISDRADLEERRARLESIEYAGDVPDLAGHFSAVLQGLLEWESGNDEAALASLKKGHVPIGWNQGYGPILDESINRWVTAEILRESGRLQEALPYYESLVGMNNFPGILYLGPSYLRRAEIYEQIGDDSKAIDYYTRLINLWEDGDPEVQVFVDQARAGLDRVLDRGTREPTGG